MTPTPSLLMEPDLDKLAEKLLLRAQKVRVRTTQDLMITLKKTYPYLTFKGYFSSNKMRSIKKKGTISYEAIGRRGRLPTKCWKCGAQLVVRDRRLYCPRCRRTRHFILQWKSRGGGHMSRVDVRESGRQHKRVLLE